MLRNCERFIDRRCEGGQWPTYVELEAERDRAVTLLRWLRDNRFNAHSTYDVRWERVDDFGEAKT
jgi:hypothetical protein